MKDIVSLNRQFLLTAKQHADKPEVGLLMGLSSATLEALRTMTIEQIDALAERLPLSAITVRLTPAQFEVASANEKSSAAFMVSAMASKK